MTLSASYACPPKHKGVGNKPASYLKPDRSRLGKDGVHIFCCADCKSFERYDNRCGKHDFVTAKSARCGDYQNQWELGADDVEASPLFTRDKDADNGFSTMRGAGFESLAALCQLRDELVEGMRQMEQEPEPERYTQALPEFAAEVDRLADWLAEKRQWIGEKEGQERLQRWQEMLEDISRLSTQDRFLLFPLLRGLERLYARKAFRAEGIHRAEATDLILFIRAMYVKFNRFPALLGHWYEVTGCKAAVVEIVSAVPLVGRAGGEDIELVIEQLGACLTA